MRAPDVWHENFVSILMYTYIANANAGTGAGSKLSTTNFGNDSKRMCGFHMPKISHPKTCTNPSPKMRLCFRFSLSSFQSEIKFRLVFFSLFASGPQEEVRHPPAQVAKAEVPSTLADF